MKDNGLSNPFDTPLGPTPECLSSNQMVQFTENKKVDESIRKHLEGCEFCRKRHEFMKSWLLK